MMSTRYNFLLQFTTKYAFVVKIILVTIFIQGLAWVSLAQAETINVTTCNTNDLVAAINTANGNGQADVINLVGNCHYQLTKIDNTVMNGDFISHQNGLPIISSSITIEGHGATIERVGEVPFRFFLVAETGRLTLSQVTLKNGWAMVTQTLSSPGNQGGAIYNLQGVVVLSHSTIITNRSSGAFGDGGAIYNDSGTLQVTHGSIISGNFASGRAGAISSGGWVTITESSLISNEAVSSGGAIWTNSYLWINNSVIMDNKTKDDGGGIWSNYWLWLHGSQVMNNRSGSVGGGIWAQRQSEISQTIVSNNYASSLGGGIVHDINGFGLMMISQSSVENNSARFAGGVANYANMTLNNTAIISNEAFSFAGGIGNFSTASHLVMTNVTMADNLATNSGGAMENYGFITMTHSTIVGNYSYYSDAGGIYNKPDANIALSNSIVAKNETFTEDKIPDVAGDFKSLGFNIIGVITGSTGFGVADLIGVDPLLSSLQDNGGPTLSLMPLPTSPAIDEGQCLPDVTTDQRGQPRPSPISPYCDIGAVESALLPTADLALSQTVNVTRPTVASEVNFVVTLTSQGPNRARGVVVEDKLPSGYKLLTATPTQGRYNEGTGAWDVGTVVSGTVATLTVEVEVQASSAYTNYVQVQASQAHDPDSTAGSNTINEDDEASITIVPRVPLLTISKRGPKTARANEPIVYSLFITNSGEAVATNLIVTDTIPMNAIYLGGGNAVISQVLFWPSVPRLEVGQTAQVNFTVKATQDITNSDYGVMADGAAQARGVISVVTDILVGSKGVFENSGQLLGQANSRAVALADFDKDGDKDAFVANVGPNEVWLNDGSGKFSNNGQSLGNSLSQAVNLADIDHDGDMDAVVGNQGADEVWLNDGTGQFSQSNQTLSPADTRAVALADIDKDGDVDAVLGNQGADGIWLNDGTGKFNDSGQTLSAGDTQAVALADFDHDGAVDLVLGDSQNSQIWLNDGTGKFNPHGPLLSNDNVQAIALGDVDGDGNTDLVLGNEGNNAVWLNDGTGMFNQSSQNLGQGDTEAVSLADLDEDGDLDLVLGNVGDSQVWLNDGTGHFGNSGQNLGSDDDVQAVALGDLDGDTDFDTFVGNGTPPTTPRGARRQISRGSQVWFNQNERSMSFDKDGGLFDVSQGMTFTLDVAANTFDQTTVLTYTPLATITRAISKEFKVLNARFILDAEQQGVVTSLSLSKPLMVTIYYPSAGVDSTQVSLYYFDTVQKQWRDVATTCTPTSPYLRGANFIRVGLCHLTEFALVEKIATRAIYLPLVVK